jgi:hypothetical protein
MIELSLTEEYHAKLVQPGKDQKKPSDYKTSNVSGKPFLRDEPKVLENPFIP